MNKNKPALPFIWEDSRGTHVEDGISIRQYYAAKAMQGLVNDPCGYIVSQVIRQSFEIADAMIDYENKENK